MQKVLREIQNWLPQNCSVVVAYLLWCMQ